MERKTGLMVLLIGEAMLTLIMSLRHKYSMMVVGVCACICLINTHRRIEDEQR